MWLGFGFGFGARIGASGGVVLFVMLFVSDVTPRTLSPRGWLCI